MIIPSVFSALLAPFNFKLHEVLGVGGGPSGAGLYRLLLGLAAVILHSVWNLLRIIYQVFARGDARSFAA